MAESHDIDFFTKIAIEENVFTPSDRDHALMEGFREDMPREREGL